MIDPGQSWGEDDVFCIFIFGRLAFACEHPVALRHMGRSKLIACQHKRDAQQIRCKTDEV